MQNKNCFTKNSCGVFITRAQPFHNGHLNLIVDAVKNGGMQQLKIFIGSANQSRTYNNPFSYRERFEMIHLTLSKIEELKNLDIDYIPLNDNLYNNQRWSVEFLSKLYKVIDKKRPILLGYEKDESSSYLKWFPELERWTPSEKAITYNNEHSNILNATDIRKKYFSPVKYSELKNTFFADALPIAIQEKLERFNEYERPYYEYMAEYYNFIEEYKNQWAQVPYSPTFVTTDAIVTTNNCILMIKRKNFPDKGKWALPGGFLDIEENIKKSMLRELKEETKLKVPEKVLEGSIAQIEIFDLPNRDPRGRVISHVFYIPLQTGYTELPHIAGSSDASKAKWIPIADIVNMQDKISFDHWSILSYVLGI